MIIKIPIEWSQKTKQFDPSFNMSIDGSRVKIDETLTKQGYAADAKVVGDALNEKQPKGNYILKINGQVPNENGDISIEEGTNFTTDETLTLSKEGVLSVNTTDIVEQDNTLPVTSAAVATQVGNIEVILQTI